MDHAGLVGVVERVGRLDHDAPCLRNREAPLPVEYRAKRLPAHPWHDEIRQRLTFPHRVDRHEVGVPELRHRLRLALEPFQQYRGGMQVVSQRLDRHFAIQPDVARGVHFGESAPSDELAQLVARTQRVPQTLAMRDLTGRGRWLGRAVACVAPDGGGGGGPASGTRGGPGGNRRATGGAPALSGGHHRRLEVPEGSEVGSPPSAVRPCAPGPRSGAVTLSTQAVTGTASTTGPGAWLG